MKKIVLFSFFILIIASTSIYAHKGKTDKYGGHYDRSEGTYHYHSGKYKGTGDYTAPVEEGGKKIDELKEVKQEVKLNDSDDEEYYNNKIKELEDKIESLQTENNNNKEVIEEKDREIEKKDEEINTLKNNENGVWGTSIFIICLIAVISYQVGKNRK